MAYTIAPAVRHALNEANRRWPNRNRASDGTIGDADHSSRSSDHNPDERGVVLAFDLTHDPARGVDCEELYAHLVKTRDWRVRYIIWRRTITSGDLGPQSWIRRPYKGKNPHDKHMHVSVRRDHENDLSDWWDVEIFDAAPAAPLSEEDEPVNVEPGKTLPLLVVGRKQLLLGTDTLGTLESEVPCRVAIWAGGWQVLDGDRKVKVRNGPHSTVDLPVGASVVSIRNDGKATVDVVAR